MATKLRSFATSTVTKLLLWVLFIGFSFYTLAGAVSVYRTGAEGDLPVDSLGTMEYTDSWEFYHLPSQLVTALYAQLDLSKVEDLQGVPLYNYRAEYQDGSSVTNIPQVSDAAAFVKQSRAYGIYRTLPTGEWEQLARAGGGSRDRGGYPQPIQRDMKWTQDGTVLFPDSSLYYEVPAQATAPDAAFNATSILDATSEPNYVTYEETVPTEELGPYGWTQEVPCPQVTVYYAFDDASLAEHEAYWQQSRRFYLSQFGLLAGLAAAAALCAICLLAVCGKKPADCEVHLLGVDRLWTEINLTLWGAAAICFAALATIALGGISRSQLYRDPWMVNLFCGGLTALAAVFLLFTLSLARQLKAHVFLKNSLTYKCLHWCWGVCKKVWDMFRSCFDERAFQSTPLTKALQKRQTVFLVTLGLALAAMLIVALADGAEIGVLLMLLLMAGIGVVTFWQVQGNRKTYLEINKGFNESFEEQMKSERTKTALVTNVSHDLKTPLTSIITYVDLLGQEELPDTARDYVAILAQKSERLKAIVSDLFDLTKSSSGNLPLDLEVLDLKRLLEQTLADMKDSVDSSGLALKVKLPESEVNIYSDGKKLYRVFQNLIDNALKYSLEGSRVFVTLDEQGGLAVASVKNTSSYEMDFTAEEILQRFNRGDKSRSGDGSGLGLSIAESFTNACGGDFKVEIDGDLFKVTATFKIDSTSRAMVEV